MFLNCVTIDDVLKSIKDQNVRIWVAYSYRSAKCTFDGEMIWPRTEQSRFPEITELKQLVRDRGAPDRSLGHADKK